LQRNANHRSAGPSTCDDPLQRRESGSWNISAFGDDNRPGNAAFIDERFQEGFNQILVTQYFTSDTSQDQQFGGVDPMPYSLALICQNY
jgi:hypothetical protein